MSELTDRTIVRDIAVSSSSSISVVSRAAPCCLRGDTRWNARWAMDLVMVYSSIVFHAQIAGIDHGRDGFYPIGAAVERVSITALPGIEGRSAADQGDAD